jgi:hypothetical protein
VYGTGDSVKSPRIYPDALKVLSDREGPLEFCYLPGTVMASQCHRDRARH